MNKGFYHPVHNPRGYGLDLNGKDYSQTTYEFNSFVDCLNPDKVDLDGEKGKYNVINTDLVSTENFIRTSKISSPLNSALNDFIVNELNIYDGGYQEVSFTNRFKKSTINSSGIIGVDGYTRYSFGINATNTCRIYKKTNGTIDLPKSGGFSIRKTDHKEISTILASDADANDLFGSSVAIDGNRLIIGAPSEDSVGTDAGKVYVYDWNSNDSVYDQVSTLTASDAQANDLFGTAVAVDGNRLIVGAPSEDSAATNAGKVYVYDWNSSTSSYDEATTLTASDAQADDEFGWSVALDGNRLIVGAHQEDTAATDAGKVYVYDWNSSNSVYDEVTTLTASDAKASESFGSAVSVDGGRLIVGSRLKGVTQTGKVYVYDWNATDTVYDEITTITASDAQDSDYFGTSVAVEGNRLIVSAYQEDSAAEGAGKVYVYDWHSSTSTYDELTTITASDALANDHFGSGIALDGNRVIIGAHTVDAIDTTAIDAGKVYVYDYEPGRFNFSPFILGINTKLPKSEQSIFYATSNNTSILLDSEINNIDEQNIIEIGTEVASFTDSMNNVLEGNYENIAEFLRVLRRV